MVVIAEDMDYLLEPITGEDERKALYRSILIHLQDSKPRKYGLKGEDLTGVLGHVLVAILAVIPSLIPFVVLRHDYDLATACLHSYIVHCIVRGWFSLGKLHRSEPVENRSSDSICCSRPGTDRLSCWEDNLGVDRGSNRNKKTLNMNVRKHLNFMFLSFDLSGCLPPASYPEPGTHQNGCVTSSRGAFEFGHAITTVEPGSLPQVLLLPALL